MSSSLYSAKTVADSVSPTGVRLTTLELVFPRFILSEFNTHRVFSRNSASSRAIPVSKQLKKILETPFIPERFGINEPGMQAQSFLTGAQHDEAVQTWERSRSRAVISALELLLGVEEADKLLGSTANARDPFSSDDEKAKVIEGLQKFETYVKEQRLAGEEQNLYLNVHKQTANRILEPYTWHTVLVTSTEWSNFWALRTHPDAQPEIQKIAIMAKDVYENSTPERINYNEWHMPLLHDDEKEEARKDPDRWLKIVSGRCARTSYETHDGRRDPEADIKLFSRLASGGHVSPLEHAATPLSPNWKHEDLAEERWSGNFRGWQPYRKTVAHEDDYGKILSLQ
jgi:thymidylate synthase ThyX